MHRPGVLWFLLATLAFAGVARAQRGEVKVSSQVEPRTVYLGDRAVLTITVEGTLQAQADTPPPVEGVSITPAGTVVHPAPTLILNGRRQDTGPDSVDVNFRVSPVRAGVYEIPGTTVRVNGQPYQAPPTTITVLEPERSDTEPLVIEPSVESAFVGEPIRVRVAWILPDWRVVRSPSLSGTLVEGSARVFEPADRSWLGQATEQFRLPTPDGEMITGVVQDPRAGSQGLSIVFDRIVVADEQGTLRLGPLTMAFDRIEGTGRTSRVVRRLAESEPIEIDIRPLPTAGRPPHFAGLVTATPPTIEVSVEPTAVRVGDPIELLARVRADEPIGRVDPPPLERQPGFADGLKLSPDGWELVERSATESIWRTVVRARSDAVTEIPALELAWFDTALREYRVARAEAVPLSVEPTEQVTIEDAEIGAGGEPVPTLDLLDAPASVRANYDDPDELLVQESPDPLPRLSTTGWVAVAAGPPALFACCARGVWIGSDRQRRARRRRAAGARARQRLARSGDDPAQIASAIRGFVADRFGREPGSLTDAECLEMLGAAHEPASLEPVRTVLNTCAEACYAGSEQRVSADAARRALEGLRPRSEA
ncbi:MAG: BatD family protein [Phycisphaerales bacterium JB037]